MSLPQTESMILAGCMTPLIAKFKDRLFSEMFDGEYHALIFSKLLSFYKENGLPMSREAFLFWVENLNAEQKIMIEPIAPHLNNKPEESHVLARVEQFIQDYKERETKAIADLAGELRKGRDEEIREKMMGKLVDINVKTNPRPPATEDFTSPESFQKHLDFMARQKRKDAGVNTGIRDIDRKLNGGRPGDLWVYFAGSKHGKSTMMRNHAHYSVTKQKKNILFFSAELDLDIMRITMGAIHAFKKFGYEDLNTETIRNGTLTPDQENRFNEAMQDLNNNPEYGKLIMEKADGGFNIRDLHMRAEEVNKTTPLDGIFIDYFDRLGSLSKKGNKDHIDKGETFVYGKQNLALGFNNGKGIFVCTAHQINQTGTRLARRRNGVYVLEDASNTADAYRSADVVISIFQCAELEQEDPTVPIPEIMQNTTRMAILASRFSSAYPRLPFFDVESQLKMSVMRSFEEMEAKGDQIEFSNLRQDEFEDLLGIKKEKKDSKNGK